jgi:hypothetical protein
MSEVTPAEIIETRAEAECQQAGLLVNPAFSGEAQNPMLGETSLARTSRKLTSSSRTL